MRTLTHRIQLDHETGGRTGDGPVLGSVLTVLLPHPLHVEQAPSNLAARSRVGSGTYKTSSDSLMAPPGTRCCQSRSHDGPASVVRHLELQRPQPISCEWSTVTVMSQQVIASTTRAVVTVTAGPVAGAVRHRPSPMSAASTLKTADQNLGGGCAAVGAETYLGDHAAPPIARRSVSAAMRMRCRSPGVGTTSLAEVIITGAVEQQGQELGQCGVSVVLARITGRVVAVLLICREQAALVREHGWSDYESISSGGEVAGVRAVVNEQGAVDADVWAPTRQGR